MESLRRLILSVFQPILEWIGRISFPIPHEKLSDRELEELQNSLEVGDVVVTKTYGELSNLFIIGKYKHAFMYLGRGEFVEAISPIVRKTSIERVIDRKEHIAVCRNLESTLSQRAEAARIAESYVGFQYDFDFHIPQDIKNTASNEKFYCSELVWYAHYQANQDMQFRLREIFGVQTVIPDDFVKATKFWETVYELER